MEVGGKCGWVENVGVVGTHDESLLEHLSYINHCRNGRLRWGGITVAQGTHLTESNVPIADFFIYFYTTCKITLQMLK